MHWLLFLLILGCTRSPTPPSPAPPPPMEWRGTLEKWEIIKPARPARAVKKGGHLEITPLPGGPSWGTKAVKDFGVIASEKLGYLLVDFSKIQGRAKVNWLQRPWNGKGFRDNVLGPVEVGPTLFRLGPGAISGLHHHQLGIRISGQSAELTHLEWIPAPQSVKTKLTPKKCAYLLYDTGEGEWEIRWGKQVRKGSSKSVGVWKGDQMESATITGKAPVLFRWAGCQPDEPSQPSGEN